MLSFFSTPKGLSTVARVYHQKEIKISLTELIDFIKAGDLKSFDYYLNHDPRVLKFARENHIARLVTIHGEDPELIKCLARHLKKNHKMDLLLAVDQEGNSPLHHAVMLKKTEMANALLSVMDENSKCDAVTMINNTGKSPFNIACEIRKKDRAQGLGEFKTNPGNALIAILEPLAVRNRMKPLNEPLDEKKVAARYPNANHRLQRNLKVGCEVANKLRGIPKLKSVSHGSFNDDPDSHDIKRTNRDMQKKYFALNALIPAAFNDKTEAQKEYFKRLDQLTQEYKLSNCEILAILGLKVLDEIASDLHGEVFATHNGDHAFLVIDRDPNSSTTDFTKWGNAVVVDIWSGEVFPANEIPSKLYYHEFYYEHPSGCLKNITGKYNQKYNQLQKMELLTPNKDMAEMMSLAVRFNECDYLEKILKTHELNDEAKTIALDRAIDRDNYRAMVILLERAAKFENMDQWNRAIKIVPQKNLAEFQQKYEKQFIVEEENLPLVYRRMPNF